MSIPSFLQRLFSFNSKRQSDSEDQLVLERFKFACLASVAVQVVVLTDDILQYSVDIPLDVRREIRQVRLAIDGIRNSAREKSTTASNQREVGVGCYEQLLEDLNMAVRELRELLDGVFEIPHLVYREEIGNNMDVISCIAEDIYEYQWQTLNSSNG